MFRASPRARSMIWSKRCFSAAARACAPERWLDSATTGPTAAVAFTKFLRDTENTDPPFREIARAGSPAGRASSCPVKVLSRVFRRLFLCLLATAHGRAQARLLRHAR
jgi:hypothetical protein